MSISKHKSGFRVHVSVNIDGERVRKTEVVSTMCEAKQRETELRFMLKNGMVETKLTPFNVYGQRYLDDLIGVSNRTKQGYIEKFCYVSEIMTKPINKYRNSDIRRIMKGFIDRGLAPRSVKHIHSITKRIFSQASLDFQIPNPCGTFKQDTSIRIAPNKTNKALTLEEQERFIDYLTKAKNETHKYSLTGDYSYPANQEYIYGVIALSTGMRRGELCALRWENVDLIKKEIHVKHAISYANKKEELSKPKTESGIRTIQIDDELTSQIRLYKAFLVRHFKFGDMFEDGWVFPVYEDSKVNTPITCWSQRMAKVFKYTGIKNSLHGLRHTHASNLLMNNYPTLQLSHRLGHADPSITLSIYSHYVKGAEIDINDYQIKYKYTDNG